MFRLKLVKTQKKPIRINQIRFMRSLGLAATTAVAAFDAKFGEQLFRRTEPSKATLQKVEADKGGEGEEPFRDKDRAFIDAQRQ